MTMPITFDDEQRHMHARSGDVSAERNDTDLCWPCAALAAGRRLRAGRHYVSSALLAMR